MKLQRYQNWSEKCLCNEWFFFSFSIWDVYKFCCTIWNHRNFAINWGNCMGLHQSIKRLKTIIFSFNVTFIFFLAWNKKKMISRKWDNWLTGSRMIRSAFSYSRQATEKYKFVSDTSKMLEIHPKASFTKYYCQGRWTSEKSLNSKFFSSGFFFFLLKSACFICSKCFNIYQTTQINKNYFFFQY